MSSKGRRLVGGRQPRSSDETRFNELLGSHIARARRFREISMPELAAAVGVSRSQLYHWESGRDRVPVWRLHKISVALGVSVTALMPKSTVIELLKKEACAESGSS